MDTSVLLDDRIRQFPCEGVCYAAIAGSHSYGLATAESDIDVRGIFCWTLDEAIQLYPPSDTISRTSTDLDFSFWEIGKALRLLCNNNGNLIELLHNPLCVFDSEIGAQMKELSTLAISAKLADYYRGYSFSQRKRAVVARGGKALVYAYREIYAGICLLETGRIVFDFFNLIDYMSERGFYSELLAWAMGNRKAEVDEIARREYERELDRLDELIDKAREGTRLPQHPPPELEERANALLYNCRTWSL